MKILLINQTFYPDVAATAQQLADFAVDLVRRGFAVTVLTGRRSYVDPRRFYPAREVYQGIEIVRVASFAFGKTYKIARIFDALFMNTLFAWYLLWLGRFDRTIAMTTPPLVGLIALIFSKLRRTPFAYWMMDINPDQAIQLGWLSERSIYARLLERMLKLILGNADRVVVLDEFMRERILQKLSIAENIHVVPPWPHDDDLETISHEKNPFREAHRLEDKFVVMYSGNHSICHPLDTLLQAAFLVRNDPNIVFLFVGGGVRTEDVRKFKAKHKLGNVIQLPYEDRKNIKYSLSAADLHAVVMGEPFVGIVHPCKVYGVMVIGRPFVYIGPKKSHIGRLISSESFDYHVNHGEADKLVETIQTVRKLSSEERASISEREKRIVGDFSRRRLVPQLIDAVLG